MVSITLAVSKELKKEMDEFEIINWSAVAREAIELKIAELKTFNDFKRFEEIASKSKLTEKDALELGRKINENLSKRYIKEHNKLKKREVSN